MVVVVAVVVGQLLHKTGHASRVAIPRSGPLQTSSFSASVVHSIGSTLPLQVVGGVVVVDVKVVVVAVMVLVVLLCVVVVDETVVVVVVVMSGQVLHNTGHNL